MMMRGARGAITVEENTVAAILEATEELMRALRDDNDIEQEMVASVLFTTTPDLNACFPAKAARNIGWHQVALMGFQEIAVPDGVPMCIRVLIHWNTTRTIDQVQHVFLRRAIALRPDLANKRATQT